MLKRKEINKNKSIKSFILGCFLITSGVLVISSKYLYNYLQNKKEINLIEEFYSNQKEIKVANFEVADTHELTEVVEIPATTQDINYIAVIKIPKINLEKGLCSKGAYCNYINRNIQILDEADYPDKKNGNFILAGHSGTGNIAYFKNLYKLELGDEISIFYNGKEYKYQIKNIYDIEKTGTADIVRNMNKTTLTLITCRKGTNKQIIFICELVEVLGGNE